VARAPESRSERFAAEFETAQNDFIRLVESVDEKDWSLVGQNYPQRMNDEDEGRTVGVIADHVAESGPMILGRLQAVLEGRPPASFDARTSNARHAMERAGVTRDDVLARLRSNTGRISDAVRAIPDEQLDMTVDTLVGPMSVAQRIERVLIGHVKFHHGSIQAAVDGARQA
jgi:hypothetical protein